MGQTLYRSKFYFICRCYARKMDNLHLLINKGQSSLKHNLVPAFNIFGGTFDLKLMLVNFLK